MSPLTYHRPQTIKEALDLLEAGVPLAGGTRVVPQRRRLEAVIDLQDLGLDGIEASGGVLRVGATAPLQKIMENVKDTIPALAEACRREAALNLRNQSTLVGLIRSSGGRSPLLCALLALNPRLRFEPAGQMKTLEEALEERESAEASLVTRVDLTVPAAMAYEAAARAPMDRPLVAAAAARFDERADEPALQVALGGYGSAPRLFAAAAVSEAGELPDQAAQAYAEATDEWATGEYRSAVARTLVGRVLEEVGN